MNNDGKLCTMILTRAALEGSLTRVELDAGGTALTPVGKSDDRMTAADKQRFLAAYRARIRAPHVRDTLDERVQLRDPFVLLRAISWPAMGWAAYQCGFDGVKNPDTWATLERYMDLGVIRSLFDPYLLL